MHSARMVEEEPPNRSAAPIGAALTAVAERRSAGAVHTICALPAGGAAGEPRTYPTGGAGPEVPMWVTGSSGVPCHGQLFDVVPGASTWLYLLVSGTATDPLEVWLHYRDAVEPEWLHLGDRPGTPDRGPTVVRVPVPRPEPLVAVRLPEAGDLRVHAVTTSAVEPAPASRGTRLVDLSGHVNCVGIEPTARPGSGAFNIWHNTFPLAELPPAGSVTVVGGVPFLFPAADGTRPDNVRCRGQRIALPVDRVDWLHLLAASERRTEDALSVHYADGTTRTQWLRVSDFWPETPPRFGELLAFRTSAMLYPNHVDSRMPPAIWRQRVPVSVRAGVVAVTLPDNPAIHVFALTTLDEGPVPR